MVTIFFVDDANLRGRKAWLLIRDFFASQERKFKRGFFMMLLLSPES